MEEYDLIFMNLDKFRRLCLVEYLKERGYEVSQRRINRGIEILLKKGEETDKILVEF